MQSDPTTPFKPVFKAPELSSQINYYQIYDATARLMINDANNATDPYTVSNVLENIPKSETSVNNSFEKTLPELPKAPVPVWRKVNSQLIKINQNFDFEKQSTLPKNFNHNNKSLELNVDKESQQIYEEIAEETKSRSLKLNDGHIFEDNLNNKHNVNPVYFKLNPNNTEHERLRKGKDDISQKSFFGRFKNRNKSKENEDFKQSFDESYILNKGIMNRHCEKPIKKSQSSAPPLCIHKPKVPPPKPPCLNEKESTKIDKMNLQLEHSPNLSDFSPIHAKQSQDDFASSIFSEASEIFVKNSIISYNIVPKDIKDMPFISPHKRKSFPQCSNVISSFDHSINIITHSHESLFNNDDKSFHENLDKKYFDHFYESVYQINDDAYLTPIVDHVDGRPIPPPRNYSTRKQISKCTRKTESDYDNMNNTIKKLGWTESAFSALEYMALVQHQCLHHLLDQIMYSWHQQNQFIISHNYFIKESSLGICSSLDITDLRQSSSPRISFCNESQPYPAHLIPNKDFFIVDWLNKMNFEFDFKIGTSLFYKSVVMNDNTFIMVARYEPLLPVFPYLHHIGVLLKGEEWIGETTLVVDMLPNLIEQLPPLAPLTLDTVTINVLPYRQLLPFKKSINEARLNALDVYSIIDLILYLRGLGIHIFNFPASCFLYANLEKSDAQFQIPTVLLETLKFNHTESDMHSIIEDLLSIIDIAIARSKTSCFIPSQCYDNNYVHFNYAQNPLDDETILNIFKKYVKNCKNWDDIQKARHLLGWCMWGPHFSKDSFKNIHFNKIDNGTQNLLDNENLQNKINQCTINNSLFEHETQQEGNKKLFINLKVLSEEQFKLWLYVARSKCLYILTNHNIHTDKHLPHRQGSIYMPINQQHQCDLNCKQCGNYFITDWRMLHRVEFITNIRLSNIIQLQKIMLEYM